MTTRVRPCPTAGTSDPMSENQRETFRVDADPELQAELFHEGRVSPCALQNLSAGGAKVSTQLQMPAGAQCTLGVRLGGKLRAAAGLSYVSFLMQVLDATTQGANTVYRLQSMTAPGSSDHEDAIKLVFAAQRRALARSSGTDESSPMVSDEDRRRDLRPERKQRFSRGSLRPDQD